MYKIREIVLRNYCDVLPCLWVALIIYVCVYIHSVHSGWLCVGSLNHVVSLFVANNELLIFVQSSADQVCQVGKERMLMIQHRLTDWSL